MSKAMLRAFSSLLAQVRRDSMLLVMVFAPLIAGALFRFGIPALDAFLAKTWTGEPVLAPYAPLFDAMLAFLTPYLACTIASFVLLEERDDRLASYFAVTPVGVSGYLASRLLLPAACAFVATPLLLAVFHLSALSFFAMVLLALIASAFSVAVTVVIVSAAANKVEGLAVVKLSGISLLGLFAPFFVHGWAQYLFAVFPSFFLAQSALACAALSQNTPALLLNTMLGIVCSCVWAVAFYPSFIKKLR